MATTKQRRAAKRNIRKAQAARRSTSRRRTPRPPEARREEFAEEMPAEGVMFQTEAGEDAREMPTPAQTRARRRNIKKAQDARRSQ